MAEIEGQYFDPTSGLTFLHRAYQRLSTQHREPAAQRLSGTVNSQPLMTVGDQPFLDDAAAMEMPEKATAIELIAFYFNVCVVTYHIFHRHTVLAWLDTMMANIEQGLPLHRGIGHARASCILTILAIASLRQRKIHENGQPGAYGTPSLGASDRYFQAAAELTRAETGLPRLESAQARLIQVLYLLQTSRMNQAWYVFGTTSQIIQALGLHRRAGKMKHGSSRSSKPDYVNAQCRKRTFWSAYIIDKYLSVVFGRPMQHRDEDIDQDFPDCVNDEDMTPQGPSGTEPQEDCHLDASIFHAKLARIIGMISREVYAINHTATHERIDAAHSAIRQLHQWRDSLPSHLGTVRPSSLIPSFRRQAIALKLAYSHAIIHANRPFLLGHRTRSSGRAEEMETAAMSDSVEECITAARAALEIVDSMASDGSVFHAFWWTSYVTFCALAVVYVWEIQRLRLERGSSVDSPTHRYSIVLEELRTEARRQVSSISAGNGEPSRQGAGFRLPLDGKDSSGHGGDTLRVREPALSIDTPMIQDSFDVHGDGNESLYEMQNLLDGWQTTDWLDLDSSAFGLFTQTGGSPDMWEVP
ncbi:hypothetical protein VTK73DRAFT_2500 [Phialemonium thermophilum]|uniref:Xylanolytic transcriptional activator regulatory domain-containing protein n=1 Tax=Phialemonium thermophilum TaxID=223376 RepID=A0ABR3Y1D2_9PEZI